MPTTVVADATLVMIERAAEAIRAAGLARCLDQDILAWLPIPPPHQAAFAWNAARCGGKAGQHKQSA